MKITHTDIYLKWFNKLKDETAKATITRRLDMIRKYKHLGDYRFVGENIYEIRIHCGAGYRLYFTMKGDEVVLLLCGGDKSSQNKDIEIAKKIAKEV